MFDRALDCITRYDVKSEVDDPANPSEMLVLTFLRENPILILLIRTLANVHNGTPLLDSLTA
jgi:hypothetical protein